MKYLVFLSLVFGSLSLFAVSTSTDDNKKKNNRKVIDLFENKKIKHSFGGRSIAKSQLDDSQRPVGEDEIEVEENFSPPYRVINLRDVQKSVFEENRPEKTDSQENSN